MGPAKMRSETVFRNAVAPVSPALVPRVVFMLPVLCPVVLPDIAVGRVLFTLVCFVTASPLVGWLVMGLRMFPTVIVFPFLAGMLFAPLLLLVRPVFVRLLLRR